MCVAGGRASAAERPYGAALGKSERPRGRCSVAAGARGITRRGREREQPQSPHRTLQDGKKPIDVVCDDTSDKSIKPAVEALLRNGAFL